MLMFVLMTLTSMKGDSGSVKAEKNQRLVILTTNQAISIKLATTVSLLFLHDLDIGNVYMAWKACFTFGLVSGASAGGLRKKTTVWLKEEWVFRQIHKTRGCSRHRQHTLVLLIQPRRRLPPTPTPFQQHVYSWSLALHIIYILYNPSRYLLWWGGRE